MQRIQQLLEGLRTSLAYEKKEMDLKNYILKMNVLLKPTTPYQPCGHCSALMKRYHSDFQKALWTQILEEDSRYVPELPKFETAGLNNEYQQRNLRIIGLSDLVAIESNLRNQSIRLKRKNNPIDAQRFIDDNNSLRDYRLAKYNYFEEFLPNLEKKLAEEKEMQEKAKVESRDRSIDKEELVKMKNDGATHKECAKHFGVTSGAISQALKKLNYVKPKKKNTK